MQQTLARATLKTAMFTAKDVNRMSVWEEIFIVFAAAFVLDEYSASIEYGWNVYMANVSCVFQRERATSTSLHSSN